MMFRGGRGDIALQAINFVSILGSITLVVWGLMRNNGLALLGVVLFTATSLAFVAFRSSVDQHTEWTGCPEQPLSQKPQDNRTATDTNKVA